MKLLMGSVLRRALQSSVAPLLRRVDETREFGDVGPLGEIPSLNSVPHARRDCILDPSIHLGDASADGVALVG